MKKYVIIILFTLFINYSYSQFNAEWVNVTDDNGWAVGSNIGTNGNNTCISAHFEGASYLYVNSEYIYSNGDYDVFFGYYNNSGDLLWYKSGGNYYTDYSSGAAIDEFGNAYFSLNSSAGSQIQMSDTSYYSSGFSLLKYDSYGDLLWLKTSSRGFVFNYKVNVDNFNNIYCMGSCGDTLIIDNDTLAQAQQGTTGASYIVKLTTNGDILWLKDGGGGVFDIAFDLSGNSYTVGSIGDTAMFDTIQLVSNYANSYISKRDSSGNVIWAKKINMYNDTSYCFVTDINISGIYLYISGVYTNTIINNLDTISTISGGSFIAKYDTDGNIIWLKKAATPNNNNSGNYNWIQGCIIKNQGLFAIVAGFGGTMCFNDTCISGLPLYNSGSYIAIFDSSGNFKSVNVYKGGNFFADVSSDNIGQIYLTGYLSNQVSFGDYTANAFSNDIFIAKLSLITSDNNNDNTPDKFNLYPNPTQDIVNLNYQNSVNSSNELTILEITGKIVFTENINCSQGQNNIQINIKNLLSGFYILNIKNKQNEILYSKKIIKQ